MVRTPGIDIRDVKRGRVSTSAERGGQAKAGFAPGRSTIAGLALAAAGGAFAYFAYRSKSQSKPAVARSSMLIHCTPQEAFSFWRDFEHFPLFMRHIESVSVIDERHSRWTAVGPLGKRIHWFAEITREQPNEFIAWRSAPESEMQVDGYVEFRQAPGNRGTYVNAAILYQPPAGAAGETFAKWLGSDPNFLMRQDLRRVKALIEAGEIPTTEGQSHGPRSLTAAFARVMDPDQPMPRPAAMAAALREKRRIS